MICQLWLQFYTNRTLQFLTFWKNYKSIIFLPSENKNKFIFNLLNILQFYIGWLKVKNLKCKIQNVLFTFKKNPFEIPYLFALLCFLAVSKKIYIRKIITEIELDLLYNGTIVKWGNCRNEMDELLLRTENALETFQVNFSRVISQFDFTISSFIKIDCRGKFDFFLVVTIEIE